MEIKIEDLLIGDEIIILGQAAKYVKILEAVKVGPPARYYAGMSYKNVRCRINIKELNVMVNKWDRHLRKYALVPSIEKTYVLESPDDTDLAKKIDLNRKRLWLVKRELI